MLDIRDITEENIFNTLGRRVPVCTTMNEADTNTVKSMLIIEQAVKQIHAKETEQYRTIEEHQDSSSVSNVPLQFDSGKI